MRQSIAVSIVIVLSLCVQAPAAENEAASTEVTGTFIVPADVASIKDSVVEIRLYEYHPMIADKAATLIDKVQIKGFAHTKGAATEKAFTIGKKPGAKINPQMRYYVTFFIHAGDPAKTPRTHIGEIDGRRGLGKVLTAGAPKKVVMKVRPVGGGRPAVKPAPRPKPRPMPGRPMPGRPGPGRKPAPKDPFTECQKAQIVFTAVLNKAQAGPVGMSYPPMYTHKLVMTVKETLRGTFKAGEEVIAHHVARQVKRPTFPVGKLCVVAAQESRGSVRVQFISAADARLLATVRDATGLPLGWSRVKGKLVSPWAAMGKKAWPAAAKAPAGKGACSVTGRPALMAGPGVSMKVEPVEPPKRIKWTNPDGDGEYRIIVTNETDKPLTVPALLSDGKDQKQKILWNESLVIICQKTARPAPGARGVTAAPRPTVLKPGQTVSTVVNAFGLKNVKWPRGGYRIEFQFCLGELSATKSFYYMSRHHDAIRAKAGG